MKEILSYQIGQLKYQKIQIVTKLIFLIDLIIITSLFYLVNATKIVAPLVF